MEPMAEARAFTSVSVERACATDARDTRAAELVTTPVAAACSAERMVLAWLVREAAAAGLETPSEAAAAEREAASAEAVARLAAATEDWRAARELAAVLVGSWATRAEMAGSRVGEAD